MAKTQRKQRSDLRGICRVTIVLENGNGDRVKGNVVKTFKVAGVTVGQASEVEGLLNEMWKRRTSDDGYVFHDGTGKPLGISFVRYNWNKAVNRAGMKGRVLHSLRATSIRNFRLANVPTAEIKAISGHSTDSVFARYNLTGSQDVQRAVAKRFVKEESKQESGSKEK